MTTPSDHWLKEDLRAGPYVRYVDDFCVFGNNKTALNELKLSARDYLGGLRLRLHDGKSRVYTTKEGVEFLGFRHLPWRFRVRKENVKRFKCRMKRLQWLYGRGFIEMSRITASVVSWVAHASYADSFRLRNALIPGYIFARGEES